MKDKFSGCRYEDECREAGECVDVKTRVFIDVEECNWDEKFEDPHCRGIAFIRHDENDSCHCQGNCPNRN